MTETGRYSHNKKTTLTVVWLFILFYLLLLILSDFFMVRQPDTLMRNHKKSEKVGYLDEYKPQNCL